MARRISKQHEGLFGDNIFTIRVAIQFSVLRIPVSNLDILHCSPSFQDTWSSEQKQLFRDIITDPDARCTNGLLCYECFTYTKIGDYDRWIVEFVKYNGQYTSSYTPAYTVKQKHFK